LSNNSAKSNNEIGQITVNNTWDEEIRYIGSF